MEISNLLDSIDNGHMARFAFQRGHVWGRDQVRSLFGSLYQRLPVGGLLWAEDVRQELPPPVALIIDKSVETLERAVAA